MDDHVPHFQDEEPICINPQGISPSRLEDLAYFKDLLMRNINIILLQTIKYIYKFYSISFFYNFSKLLLEYFINFGFLLYCVYKGKFLRNKNLYMIRRLKTGPDTFLTIRTFENDQPHIVIKKH